MNQAPEIFILIPVYNETPAIREVLKDLHAFGYSKIIIVDDGSYDDLIAVIDDFSFYYLRHAANLGQGAALQTGFEYACTLNVDLVITFDADGQHRASDIRQLVEPILEGRADVVLGSRFLGPQTTEIPVYKRILLKSATVVNWLLTGIYLTDAHNGIRALNRKALGLINLKENRMAHASEILLEIRKKGLQYLEAPVSIRYTRYSKQKGQSVFDSIKIVFDLVLHKFFK